MSFATPILFIVFNRLDTTRQVFSVIRRIKPKYLYVAADGARADNEGEKQAVQEVRDYVLQNIDWACETKTLFRNENHGSGRGVAEAITWFFAQVERGIVLEHDCLPSLSFFSFCAELLERYKNDNRIYHITGHNPLGKTETDGASYYFARVEHCWGFATWRRAWQKYSYDIQGLDDFIRQRKITKIFRRSCDQKYWLGIFRKMEKHCWQTWDYQWTYTIFQNDGICINPADNLISNIGFGQGAVHTTNLASPFNNQKRYEITEIKHPSKVQVNEQAVEVIQNFLFGVEPLWRKIVCWLPRKAQGLCRRLIQGNGKVIYWLWKAFIFPHLILRELRIRERKVSYGQENPDKTFYVIGWGKSWGSSGLFCMVQATFALLVDAVERGFVPVVDWQNYPSQYLPSNLLHRENAWEYFFEQPGGYTLADISKSKNVILSPKECFKAYGNFADINIVYYRKLFKQYIRFNKETADYLAAEYKEILQDKGKVLGVLCRGTDYTLKKTARHAIQPEVTEVIRRAAWIMAERNYQYIYLATEDKNNFELFKEYFGAKLLVNKQIRFSQQDLRDVRYISEIAFSARADIRGGKYLLGLQYLSSLNLLAHCAGFVGGITAGTWGVHLLATGFEYDYVYNLGSYPETSWRSRVKRILRII
ncbi:hypothetical protein NO2_0177 [Candidatus Termititenax persephonae]|uniref:Uncharacterized protein n=1 Tax=Candidatus Termititenax persephonae TaxID=2218525 RepID=A0A388TF91_9BACT|nr:hypothetical protein NO2_0177 [Candidatus Termititenax persephonae]